MAVYDDDNMCNQTDHNKRKYELIWVISIADYFE
jgi:hypothetical protein